MKAMERARFVKIMRSQARELRKDISEWHEDFEVDSVPEDACGDEYFDLIDGEWFNVEECEVE